MARKKLELMYKNLHASYLQMADEIFGDDNNINPSVFKEFERFGTNVGMFTGQEPEIDEELNKKYYSAVDKKYVFTNRTSGTIPVKISKILSSQEYLEEEEEEEEGIKHSLTHKSGNISQKFEKIRKRGFSKKYFDKDNK